MMPVVAVAVVFTFSIMPARSVGARALYYGDLHAHTGYSDGAVGTRPFDQLVTARANGLDFAFVTEHSEAFNVPFTLSDACLPANELACASYGAAEGVTKWDEAGAQAAQATSGSFLGLRGFEWTSDVQGHINVFFSRNFTDRARTPEASVTAFYQWLGRAPELGGGADGIAIFNHPGDKKVAGFDDNGIHNWDNLRYEPAADARMVGMDLFNGGKKATKYEPFFRTALTNGWHLGAIGVSDSHTIDIGDAKWARTGVWADSLTASGIRDALVARRVFATTDVDARVTMTATGGATGSMGDRLAAAEPVTITARADDPDSVTSITLAGPAGDIATCDTPAATLECSTTVAPGTAETWVYARIYTTGGMMYSSPVWVRHS
jgi:hypothetical protein